MAWLSDIPVMGKNSSVSGKSGIVILYLSRTVDQFWVNRFDYKIPVLTQIYFILFFKKSYICIYNVKVVTNKLKWSSNLKMPNLCFENIGFGLNEYPIGFV